jgi:hypothetical protein
MSKPKQLQKNNGELSMIETSETCATCKDNKCDIRAQCWDDETSTEKRKQTIELYPEAHNP